MKDLSKIVEGESALNNQIDSGSETNNPITKKPLEAMNESETVSKETKQTGKKGTKTNEKITVVKSPKKEITKSEPMVQNVVPVDSTEEQENPEPDKMQKKKIKAVKKNAKKAEEKVVKLKKLVKKAKKKEVKKSKLNDLKDKLGKALKKMKASIKKLKKAKK